MTENIIETKKLSKEFNTPVRKPGLSGALKGVISRKNKKKIALKNVNIKINRGEFVGIIGPNGAGKSTLIKILTGILTPSSGTASVLGFIPWTQRQNYAKRIGVVFGQRTQLWWDLPVADSFDLLKSIYKISDRKQKANLAEFSRVLGIKKYFNQPVRKLSLGERMRCDLAASLLHSPELVFLDEPTIGLDVEAKWAMREFLKKTNKKGTTVILTTHDMGDIEELCPRLIIIDGGKVIYDGPTEDVKNMVTERGLVVDFKAPSPKKITLPSGIRLIGRQGDQAEFSINMKRINVSTAIKTILTKYKVDDISITEPSIEEIIRRIYREGL